MHFNGFIIDLYVILILIYRDSLPKMHLRSEVNRLSKINTFYQYITFVNKEKINNIK